MVSNAPTTIAVPLVPIMSTTHALLAASDLNFQGNAEGRDILEGAADVLVTDGFTGNVALKAVEGTAKMVGSIVREAARSSPIAAVGGLLMKGKLGELRHELSQDNVGGGIMLGLRGVAVAAHGSASAIGIANAVRLAQRAVDERMIERTEAALKAAGALRPSEPAVSLASTDE